MKDQNLAPVRKLMLSFTQQTDEKQKEKKEEGKKMLGNKKKEVKPKNRKRSKIEGTKK